MKGNLLRVPEGEAMLVPKPSTFEDEYGYPADHPDVDPEDVEYFNSRKQNEDTPVAVHFADALNSTAVLVWLGFVNWGHETAPRRAFCDLIRSSELTPAGRAGMSPPIRSSDRAAQLAIVERYLSE